MNGIRRLAVFLTATILAVSAMPGNAAQKLFSLTTSPLSSSMTVTYNNLSGGNSYINSMTLVTPFPVANVALQPSLITGNTAILPAGCTTAAGCPAGTTISFTNLAGIGPGSAGFATMSVTAPDTSQACGSNYLWSAQAFTGNAVGGTAFIAPDRTTTATSTTTIACTLQFVAQPANAEVGTTITSVASDPSGAPVQVQALIGGAVATSFSGQVTLAQSPSSGTLSGGSLSAASGVATFSSLSLDTLGTYTLTASATGFTSAVSNAFKIFAGVLDCGDSFASSFANPGNLAADQPGYASGSRSGYNKDGVASECVPVLYTFTNTILTPPYDQVSLSWDTVSQPNAAFIYTMNWRLRPVITSNPGNLAPSPIGWTAMPRPGVAWLTDASGNPIFIPALACVSGKLPAPYGQLGAAIDQNATSITITGVAGDAVTGAPKVPSTPFPVVIANQVGGLQSTQTERMTAVGTPTQSPPTAPGAGPYTLTYTVTRGTATEGFSAKAQHAAGYQVVSTPLPIIPNDATTFPAPYTVQTQAHMCIAEHGFNAFSIGADGTTQVMYFTTVIDIGDGYVKGSFQ